MACFFGTVTGNKGSASRTGSRVSGITTTAQSYEGSVNVCLYEHDKALRVDIYIAENSSPCGEHMFSGTLDELRAKLAE